MSHAKLLISSAMATAVLASPATATLLTDFSGGTIAPGTSSYFVSPTMTEAGSYNVVSFDTLHPSWADFYDHTLGTADGAYMVVNGGSGSGGGMAWAATVAVTAGTDYELGAWFASVYGFATSTLRFKIVGDGTISSATFGAPAVTATWEHAAYTFNTGTATSVSVQIWDVSGIGDGNDYAIDDITLEVVPAPASLVVLALGSLTAMHGRRRTVR